jgi:hypothetical protein
MRVRLVIVAIMYSIKPAIKILVQYSRMIILTYFNRSFDSLSEMTRFSKNKWKYSTIGLLVVLALGFSFPQAFAAASLDSVYSIVKDIQAKINDSTFGLQAIKNAIGNGASQTSVNSLQSTLSGVQTTVNGEKPLSLVVDKSLTIPKNTGLPWITLLPNVAGKTYSGHITLASKGDGDTGAIASCFYGDGQADWFYIDSARSHDGAIVNFDFSCASLRLNPFNNSQDDSEEAHLVGVVQYQISSSITNIS